METAQALTADSLAPPRLPGSSRCLLPSTQRAANYSQAPREPPPTPNTKMKHLLATLTHFQSRLDCRCFFLLPDVYRERRASCVFGGSATRQRAQKTFAIPRKQVVTTSVALLALSLGENKQAFWEVCRLSFFLNVPLIYF